MEEKETKKEKRKIKGITLVALVVTVIAVLLVAGVAIAMITGQNIIFGTADDAQAQYSEAAKNEAAKYNYLVAQAENIGVDFSVIESRLAQLENEVQTLKSVNSGEILTTEWLNKIYPVGSIYMSINATSPETVLGGGEWEQIKDSLFKLGTMFLGSALLYYVFYIIQNIANK